MIDDFRTYAHELLRRGTPKLTAAEYAAYKADAARVAAAPVGVLLRLQEANPLDDAADFALDRALFAALEAAPRATYEAELVALHPPPDHYDAYADGASRIKVVLHPEHGVGLPELVSIPHSSRWRAHVRFADAARDFEGDAARWSHPRLEFARAAGALLLETAADAPEDAFWAEVARIDWGAGQPIPAVAAALAARVSPAACAALHSRAFERAFVLRRALEAWDAASGQRFPCGDDSFGDLIAHIVGLGQAEYAAVLADPARAHARAVAGTYRESFTYVFQYACEAYAPAILAATLRAAGPPVLVEDPALGLGIRHDGGVIFPTRFVRA